MARRKKKPLEEDLDLLEDKDQEHYNKFVNHDKYTVTVTFTVMSEDISLAEDTISDIVTEAINELAEDYEPETVIMDYNLDIDPAEVS